MPPTPPPPPPPTHTTHINKEVKQTNKQTIKEKKGNVGLHADIYVIETTEFYTMIQLERLTFIEGNNCAKLQELGTSLLYEKSAVSALIFSQISQSIWMKFSMLPQPVDLLKLMLDSLHTVNMQGRELYVSFKKIYSQGRL